VPLAAAASLPPPPDAAAAARDRAVLPLLAAALLLIAAEPASAAALADAGASPDAHATRLWDLAETVRARLRYVAGPAGFGAALTHTRCVCTGPGLLGEHAALRALRAHHLGRHVLHRCQAAVRPAQVRPAYAASRIHRSLAYLLPVRCRSKPKTAIPLVVGIFALTKLVTWTINAMLGLDPDVAF
jgi:hypothetical protein